MRVSVVSDVHGNLDGLARVAERAEFLVVLGDLLEYVDYNDHDAGVLGSVFGAEEVRAFVELRTAGRFAEIHAHIDQLWNRLSDPTSTLHEVVSDQYRQILKILGPNTLVTLGNVDMPSVWDELAPPHLRSRDGEVVDVSGVRLGFVAGGCLKKPVEGTPWTYYERPHAAYLEALSQVGAVDVLCSHVPPDIEDLRYDTRANRREMYGTGLSEAIDLHRPALSLFGHVHHPRAIEVQRGLTRCVNVGFFKRSPTPFVFDTELLSQRTTGARRGRFDELPE